MSNALFGQSSSSTPTPQPVSASSAAAPAFAPKFLDGVYACSAYGDVARQYSLWYADGDTAHELARRYEAAPMLASSSPQSGQKPNRWNVAQVPASLLPPDGARQSDPGKIMALMELPPVKMWVLVFGGGGVVNAGYLADYYRRNPEDKFPGLADRYVRMVIAAETRV